MKKLAFVLGIALLAPMAFAKVPPDYQAKVGRWTIEGRYFGDGITCNASVRTKTGTSLMVSVFIIFIKNNWQYSLSVNEGGVAVIPDSQAEGILQNRYLHKNGQRVAETGGSWEVLQEFKRCIEAGHLEGGGE